jgi:hypothetical protein
MHAKVCACMRKCARQSFAAHLTGDSKAILQPVGKTLDDQRRTRATNHLVYKGARKELKLVFGSKGK